MLRDTPVPSVRGTAAMRVVLVAAALLLIVWTATSGQVMLVGALAMIVVGVAVLSKWPMIGAVTS